LRGYPQTGLAKETIHKRGHTVARADLSFAAPLWLLIRRRHGLSYDLAGSSREGVGFDGRNTERFALWRRLGGDPASLPFFGRRFFLHACGMQDLGYGSVPRALLILIIPNARQGLSGRPKIRSRDDAGHGARMARAALRPSHGVRSTDDAIAKRISELALAGERDIDNL
jgi:hypothetical protein